MRNAFIETAKKVVTSTDFSTEEKVIICTKLSVKGKTYPWNIEKKAKAIASMEIGKPYRCKELYSCHQAIAGILNHLVKAGMVTKETVKTGNILTISNPTVEKLKNDIAWYEEYITNLKSNQLGRYYGSIETAEISLARLKATLEVTPKIFSVEEKITYYTRIA